MVRESLGEDAIIVATREEKGGKAMRVTAAIDPGDYDERSFGEKAFDEMADDGPVFETHGRRRPSASETWLQYDVEGEDGAVAEEITDALLRHAVPEDVMDQILSCATVIGFEDPGVALVAALEHLFHFSSLPQGHAQKAMMFVGPPGAGKTLAVAKAAANATMSGSKVGVISTDTMRAGGIDQLAAFTKLLQVDLYMAANPQELASQIGSLRSCDQIFIDTASTNPFDTEQIKTLARLIGAEDIEPYFVLPAGVDAEESGEMARVFATIGAHTLVPSRVDIARRLGGLLSAAHHGGMHFAQASNTPQVADGFISLNPENLARLIMPSAFRSKPKGQIKPKRASAPTQPQRRAHQHVRQKTGTQ